MVCINHKILVFGLTVCCVSTWRYFELSLLQTVYMKDCNQLGIEPNLLSQHVHFSTRFFFYKDVL